MFEIFSYIISTPTLIFPHFAEIELTYSYMKEIVGLNKMAIMIISTQLVYNSENVDKSQTLIC